MLENINNIKQLHPIHINIHMYIKYEYDYK